MVHLSWGSPAKLVFMVARGKAAGTLDHQRCFPHKRAGVDEGTQETLCECSPVVSQVAEAISFTLFGRVTPPSAKTSPFLRPAWHSALGCYLPM